MTLRFNAAVVALFVFSSTVSNAQIADVLDCFPDRAMGCSIAGCKETSVVHMTFRVDLTTPRPDMRHPSGIDIGMVYFRYRCQQPCRI
jgi:hypothetical protein